MKIFYSWQELPKSWKRGFDSARAASSFSDIRTPARRMGASLYSGSRLLSQGCNKGQTHPYYKGTTLKGEEFHGWIHAEMSALIKRTHYENKSLTIYVYRENICGDAMSRPCEKCLELLKQAKVKTMRYITYEGFYVEERV